MPCLPDYWGVAQLSIQFKITTVDLAAMGWLSFTVDAPLFILHDLLINLIETNHLLHPEFRLPFHTIIFKFESSI